MKQLLVTVSAFVLSLCQYYGCCAQGIDLTELSSSHRDAIGKYLSATIALDDGKGEYLLVVGGIDACAVEFLQRSNGTRVVCASKDLNFELFRPEGSKSYQVTNLVWRKTKPSEFDIVRTCSAEYFQCFSPLFYFEVPIINFLADPTVKHKIATQSSSAYGPVVRVTWEWTSEGQFGFFELLPKRCWVAKSYGRTKDPSVGYMVTSHEFDPESDSPIPIYRKQEIQYKGKPWEITEEDKYRVVSTSPEPPTRFQPSYYGLSNNMGKQSNYTILLVCFGLVGGYLVFRSFKRNNA